MMFNLNLIQLNFLILMLIFPKVILHFLNILQIQLFIIILLLLLILPLLQHQYIFFLPNLILIFYLMLFLILLQLQKYILKYLLLLVKHHSFHQVQRIQKLLLLNYLYLNIFQQHLVMLMLYHEQYLNFQYNNNFQQSFIHTLYYLMHNVFHNNLFLNNLESSFHYL